MGESDKRRHRRESINLVVEYEGAEDLAGDYTENLSRGGTFVRTRRVLAEGTPVRLSLSFPGLLAPISLHGRVRWTRGGDDCGVGIEFEQNEELEQLQAILDRLRAGDPALVKRVIRVLVVEDNPHVSRLIREGLSGSSKRSFREDLHFHFETAKDGVQALTKLRSRKVDALIIDVYLPVLDGPHVISELRKDEALSRMPVIAVSAGGKQAREAALAAGADFFLDKPMRLREIIDSMRKLMALEER